MSLRFSHAGRSETGRVRGNNEDAGFHGPTALVVADGVGGGAAGEVASATTAYVVAACLLAAGERPLEQVFTEAVALAEGQLREGVRREPERAGMATTLVAVATDGTRWVLAHLGDSRAYLMRAGELSQITRDHTWVQSLLDSGQLDPSEVAAHPWRNVVLRTVNAEEGQAPELSVLDLLPGDRVLLASDGLTDLVSAPRIAALLGEGDDQSAVDRLVEEALAAGGVDNVTVVVGTVVDTPPITSDGLPIGAAWDLDLIVDPAAVRPPG